MCFYLKSLLAAQMYAFFSEYRRKKQKTLALALFFVDFEVILG